MWALIAYYIRFIRQQRGMTAAEVSQIMGCAGATTSRIENLNQRLRQKHAERLDTAWNTGGLFSTLIYYARRASDPDWFKSFTEQEAVATKIRIFACQLIPGLLQTEVYARALAEAGSERDIDRLLRLRMSRQEILRRSVPPELWIILSENVLDWPVGGPAILAEQLARLIEVSDLPHVVLRVVPKAAGAYPGLDGPFMILSDKDGDTAFAQATNGGRLVADADEVRSFVDRFDRIGARALPVDSSRSLIKEVMEKLK
jgi:transcriptional regulator with XRE-family HTH domain